jgi:hypothetical protein
VVQIALGGFAGETGVPILILRLQRMCALLRRITCLQRKHLQGVNAYSGSGGTRSVQKLLSGNQWRRSHLPR